MPAKLEKIKRHPGIYKRGSRYAVIFRDHDGRQRQVAARTLDQARKVKAARTADVARGEFHPRSRETFRDYTEAWVERYQGTGRRGFRESTREDYRRLLRDFAYPFFGRRRLAEVTPSDVAGFIGWLCDGRAQAQHAHALAVEAYPQRVDDARAKERPLPKPPEPLDEEATRELSDSTVRNVLNPVRSCFATAVREGRSATTRRSARRCPTASGLPTRTVRRSERSPASS
jgi:Phage integrase, N-terminal SAM-like domain